MDISDLQNALQAVQKNEDLYKLIVNAPLQQTVEAALLFLGIVVLLLVDEQHGTIDRVALSDNERATGTKNMSVKRFEDIKIPLEHEKNLIAKAIRTGKPKSTTDWQYLFTPELTPEEARLNQAGGSIALSCVYPLTGNKRGALIFSYYLFEGSLQPQQRKFMQTYAQLVSERLDTLDR